jgi:integrase
LSPNSLFGNLSVQAVPKEFTRVAGKHASGAKNGDIKARTEAKRRTKWSVVKGYSVLRHSSISAWANKGIDQRIIDELVGHQTEAMRRRYRHLYPQTVANAVKQVFGWFFSKSHHVIGRCDCRCDRCAQRWSRHIPFPVRPG